LQVVRLPGVDVGEVVLEVRDLVVMRGKRVVVDGLSFEVRRGELAVLQAPNGWGKTSLMEALMGLGSVSGGDVRLGGVSVVGWSVWRRVRAGMSLLQSRDNVFPSLKVRAMLRIAKIRGIPEVLRDLLDKRISDLSGGERQRVVLTCFQHQVGKLQMLDEPFLALDKAGMNFFIEITYPNSNLTRLIVTPLSHAVEQKIIS
jgi:ABC-type multidrug transport system ATPase subunit